MTLSFTGHVMQDHKSGEKWSPVVSRGSYTMCKMAHFARNEVGSDDLNIVLTRAILGDLGRAGNLGR